MAVSIYAQRVDHRTLNKIIPKSLIYFYTFHQVDYIELDNPVLSHAVILEEKNTCSQLLITSVVCFITIILHVVLLSCMIDF